MELLTNNEKAEAVRDYARQTIGSEDLHRHGLCRWFYSTDGVQFLAKTCSAFWLIDAIASHVATNKRLQAEPFQSWTIHPKRPRGLLLLCTDGDKGPGPITLAEQEIHLSDFPRELLPFGLFCERGHVAGKAGFTLMLPQER